MQILDLPSLAMESASKEEQKIDSDSVFVTEAKQDATESDQAIETSRSTKRSSPPKIMFDLEWLAILRATHHLASANKSAPRVPQEELKIEDKDISWVKQRLEEFVVEKKLDKSQGEWITDFVKTVPGHGEEEGPHVATGNPQTDLFLELLKLPHVVTAPFVGGDLIAAAVEDPNEIGLDDDDDTSSSDTKLVNTEDVTNHDGTSANRTALIVTGTETPVDSCEINLDL